MTISLRGKVFALKLLRAPQNCHPRPERSVVEGPAVSFPDTTYAVIAKPSALANG
jgi:hypothetical protein